MISTFAIIKSVKLDKKTLNTIKSVVSTKLKENGDNNHGIEHLENVAQIAIEIANKLYDDFYKLHKDAVDADWLKWLIRAARSFVVKRMNGNMN